FGDAHGGLVHLFERDCTLQRRRQKVIEEAPAPGMTAEVREAVCAAALAAARAVDYVGAGTVEFIADARDGLRSDRIWFMEMNTRLQVEHPVTEAVTGVDLVEWQFRVAAGEPLPLKQNEIHLNGWAMEARLYAEDPASGFLPSIGKLEHFHLPDDVRVDTGVAAGGEVSQFYDPMIAKLIVHEPTREAAAARLATACGEVEVWPVKTNAGFLKRCLEHPRFFAGDVDTGLIAAEGEGLTAALITETVVQDSSDLLWRSRQVQSDVWDCEYGALGLRLNAPAATLQTFFIDGVRQQAGYLNNFPSVSYGPEIDGGFVIFHEGDRYEVSRHAPRSGSSAVSDGALRAPMPGRIVAAPLKAGDAVAKGQPVVVLEAMKMEHALTAPFDGVVEALSVAVGDQATEGAVLAVVKANV
ncbi:MAG: biotin/lipoyl-containing protein, partial [Brevundimonas sp.]